MGQEVFVDTDVLINILNEHAPTQERVRALKRKIVATPVTVFELWRARTRKENVKTLLDALPIYPLEKVGAQIAADMYRELERQGKTLDYRDVLIAAICIQQNKPLLTYNKKHFERLQKFGLQLL